MPNLFYISIGLAENVRIEQSVFCGNRNVCLLAQSLKTYRVAEVSYYRSKIYYKRYLGQICGQII